MKELFILKEEETESKKLTNIIKGLSSKLKVMNKKVEGSSDVLLRYLCLAVENERLTNKN